MQDPGPLTRGSISREGPAASSSHALISRCLWSRRVWPPTAWRIIAKAGSISLKLCSSWGNHSHPPAPVQTHLLPSPHKRSFLKELKQSVPSYLGEGKWQQEENTHQQILSISVLRRRALQGRRGKAAMWVKTDSLFLFFFCLNLCNELHDFCHP